ncbi:MAG: hypothetical protein RLZZ238_1262 [Planctomycetota bacterium]
MTARASIHAIATAHPSFRMTRAEWLVIADAISPATVDRRVLERLAERSGIESRWCAAFEDGHDGFYGSTEVPGTAARMRLWSRGARAISRAACTRALAGGGVHAGEVTHLVTASCTGFEAPGLDAHLIESLGLSRSVQRLHVGFMGCHAAINALAAARAIVVADPDAVVLVCCAEISSAHFHHTDRLDQLIANTLFADGAGAAIVTAARGDDPVLEATHSRLLEASAEEMGWLIGDHGFEMTLGARVPDRIGASLADWVRESLATHGLDASRIGGWAVHPGGPRVLDTVEAVLGLDPPLLAPSRGVLRDYGNMSSATLLFILDALSRAAMPRPWIGLAFGPGLTCEMLLLR